MSKVVVAIIFSVAVAAAPSRAADRSVDARPRPSNAAYLEVDYANTMHGVQALYSVRTCAMEDEAPDRTPIVRELPTLARPAFVREKLNPATKDFAVKVFSGDGCEVVRHGGTTAIRSPSHFSAAYAAIAQREGQIHE